MIEPKNPKDGDISLQMPFNESSKQFLLGETSLPPVKMFSRQAVVLIPMINIFIPFEFLKARKFLRLTVCL